MFYSEKVKKALLIAYEAHAGQFDQAGYPYFLHPYHLAEQMTDEDGVIVALLHDVVEDTDVTLDDLRREGFDETILSALSLLTHVKGIPYAEYVDRIKDDPLARRVKIADLRHNTDTTRGADTPHFKKKREECYYPALEVLLRAEAEGTDQKKASERIRRKLQDQGGKANCPMLRGEPIEILLNENGVLPMSFAGFVCEWEVFDAIVEKARELGGKMYRGDLAAQSGARIGSEDLPLDSIDGFISLNFYGGEIGSSTMRRSTYYAAILAWAGICDNCRSDGRGGFIQLR